MAENPLPQNTTSLHDADAISSFDGSGSSKGARNSGAADAPARLPLRQTMQPSRSEPRIHDLTEKFTRACEALDVGQLVKDEFFTLFESIGALEIMDPKMDSGFLQPGESLEDVYDTLAPLLPEEVISIMDQLLCHEMAWHTGYPLSQTLFTSVYIDKLLWPEPRTLEQAQFYRGSMPDSKRPGPLLEALRAYCLAQIKCCDYVIAKVTSRDYFEEEDFCTHTYNRVLFVSVPMDVFLRELDAAVESIEDVDLDINDSLRTAIITRLEFRKALLTAFDPDCPLEYLDKYWPPVLSSLPTINATQQLGKSIPGSFSPKIQRRLASTVPPRPIVELEFKDAFEKLKQLCIDCEEATRFTNLPSDPLEYQSFLWAYASRSPAPLPYSRSYLATLLFHPDTLNTPQSIPLIDLKILVLPCSPVVNPSNWTLSPPRNPLLPKPTGLQLALLIDEFIERAGQHYLDFWTALGQNKCRLRRMLTHVVLGWDQLHVDATDVDEDLMRAVAEMGIQDQVLNYPLTTWTYHKKLFMMEKIILLGFEQDIYLPDEFAGMYYFLSLISSRRLTLLQNIRRHFHDRITRCNELNDIATTAELEAGIPYIDSLLHEVTGISELSAALSKFYTVLLYLHALPHPNRPFSSEELRYEIRMKPFLPLNPPEILSFSDFQAQIQPFGPYNAPEANNFETLRTVDVGIWVHIDDNIKAAKEAFAKLKRLGASSAKAGVGGSNLTWVKTVWEKEVNGLLASCVALGVAVVGVKSALKDGDLEKLGIKIEIPGIGTGKRYHEAWIVGKVIKE